MARHLHFLSKKKDDFLTLWDQYLNTKIRLQENHRPVSLRNTKNNNKILNRILANQIKEHVKTVVLCYQVQGWFTPQNQLM